MIIQFLRYLFGYINFRAFGGFPDRFINLCTKEGIPLWNVRNINNNITASTTVQGYLSLHTVARKSGMRVISTDKVGLKYFLRKHKTRVGILAGLSVSVIVLSVLTQFVWSVSVVGNTTLEEDVILSAFEENGVRVGVPVSSIDNDEVASLVMSEIESLSWVSVNMKGSVVVIEVREKTEAPEIYDPSKPTNVIASEDGVILSIDVLYGNEEVKPGSAVTKGDLLISGVITHKDGTEKTIHADGYVKALVKKKKVSSGMDFSIYNIKKEKTRNLIFFFGLKIPLGTMLKDGYFTEHNSFIESDKNLLPVGIITQYGANISEEKATLDVSTEEKIALFSNALCVRELLEYSEIRNSKTVKQETENTVQYEISAQCEQEIGTLQEIYVEKTDDIQ
ncbi:MAG: sporulation protein YqfD [Clostridia bacterium]|nr:sporulation protein YqfD [Clostridia bacterium]